ncbi:hypothetical protein RDWZM_009888 [Blomia tropicalis]|uniref:Uncharacterized protein n=1 Tax=Blomia tropicalis TaxID=40697 RepID=A0A9Q0LVS4_BLOTA|nr:hypothetical protein RDWZM_009888 [Blomia tropicalis]
MLPHQKTICHINYMVQSLFSLRIGHVGQLSADNIKEANEHVNFKLQLLSLRELMMDEFEHITNEGDVESTLSIISQEVTRIKYEKSSSETEEKNTKEMKKKLHGFMISKIT